MGRFKYTVAMVAVCVLGGAFALRSLRSDSRTKPLASGRTHLVGTLIVPQTFSADLDGGVVVDDSKTDLWFEALTATRRYLVPMNGAMLALMPDGKFGFAECSAANFSLEKIDLERLSSGTHLCILTNESRYADIAIIEAAGPSPGLLKMTFTTWDRT